MGRGISRANDENVNLVTKARKEFAMDFYAKQEHTAPLIDTPDYTFTLPDLSVHDDENFRYVHSLLQLTLFLTLFKTSENFSRRI